MLDATLKEQIFKFIRDFRLVEEDQVIRFFSDWGRQNVKYMISSLKSSCSIFEQPAGRLSAVRTLPMGVNNYDDIIRAINVLCEVPSHRVRWCGLDIFPQEIIFVTDDNCAYDVTVFDQTNWVAKYALIPRRRQQGLPENQNDPFIHIAAIPDESLIPKIEPLGFSVFAILSQRGRVVEMKGYKED